jgi:retinol dehydrogenase-12
MLYLNAAVFTPEHFYTEDNIETMFQVNYLAQFYLTRLLIQNLENTKDSRIIILSCESHR